MKRIIVIYGATAVGKSECAEKLAQEIGGEIINADVGQLYEPLSIGTAKPDWKNSSIKHHFFDVVSSPENFTVMDYRHQVKNLIADIFARGKTPIIVGGSGFYIKSLFFPPPAVAPSLAEANKYAPEQERWKQLFELDPERARQINRNDIYRINRALDIYFHTGKKASDYKQLSDPIAPFIFINITRDRADLYNRINERTKIMLKVGWIDEVKKLMKTDWQPFLIQKKLIGYDDIISYLEHPEQITLNQLTDVIAQKTRNYAKRQICFGKLLVREIEQALNNSYAVQGIIKQIIVNGDWTEKTIAVLKEMVIAKAR